MRHFNYIIVGGGPASRILNRYIMQNQKNVTTAVLREEDRIVNHCGTPYIVEGIIKWEKGLIKEEILTQFGTPILKEKMVGGNPDEQWIETDKSNRYSYDKLIIATGTDQVIPPIEGSQLKEVLKVRKTEDLKRSMEIINSVDSIVVLGGGYIGVEFAVALCKMGKNVSLVEMLPSLFSNNYDPEYTKLIENKLKDIGINVMTSRKAVRILGTSSVEGVELDDGFTIDTRAVLSAVGVRPNVDFAETMGIELAKGGIKINDRFETNLKNVYAIGDCVETFSYVTKKPIPGKLGSNAGMMARILGLQLAGYPVKYEGVINDVVTMVEDLAFGAAGLTERELRNEGIDYIVSKVKSTSIYNNMPGCKDVWVKVMFRKSDLTIVGGEMIGYTNVAGFIEVLGEMIRSKRTLWEILTMHYSSHPEMTPKTSQPYFVLAAENVMKKYFGKEKNL